MQHKGTVISFVGRTASGKSTLAIKLARYLRTAHIETSDVIKWAMDIRDPSSRADIAAHPKQEEPDWLAKQLAIAIERKMETKERNIVVVSGIREIEVVNYLQDNYEYFGFEVKSDMPIRYERSIMDGKYLTADAFLRGEIRELDLGIREVEDDAPFAIPTSPFTNPDRLITATVRLLRKKGATLR